MQRIVNEYVHECYKIHRLTGAHDTKISSTHVNKDLKLFKDGGLTVQARVG
jgi:hypothetical protein